MTADTNARAKLPLLARCDAAVMHLLARGLRSTTRGGLPIGSQGGGKRIRHETSDIYQTLDGRGYRFDVRVFDEDGEPTAHIARVTVTLDRIEQRAEYEQDLAARTRKVTSHGV